MQILVVIIEKDGDKYTGYTPNLLGVRITAGTLEEAQNAVIDAIDKRIIYLEGLHNNEKPISRRPIEETINCVYKYRDEWNKGERCTKIAKKEGLCKRHWKELYSHPSASNLRSCPLCGESDPTILLNYDSICSFKIENPNWENILEELKFKNAAKWKKERAELRIERIKGKPRCSKIMTNGNQCTKEAHQDGLCFQHWWRRFR